MSSPKKALLLVGSPRGRNSSSEALGGYLLDRLKERGMEIEKVYIHPSMLTEKDQAEMLQAIDRSDLLVLASPLYVDSLPAPVIAALETIAEHRRTKMRKEQKLVAITNSGFPEAYQMDTALAICRKFASETKIGWAGGLAIGGGEPLHGKPLADAGWMARNPRKALDIAAAALAEDKPVPKEAVDIAAKPLIPQWMYVFVANRGFKSQAKKYGAQDKLYDRPYQA